MDSFVSTKKGGYRKRRNRVAEEDEEEEEEDTDKLLEYRAVPFNSDVENPPSEYDLDDPFPLPVEVHSFPRFSPLTPCFHNSKTVSPD